MSLYNFRTGILKRNNFLVKQKLNQGPCFSESARMATWNAGSLFVQVVLEESFQVAEKISGGKCNVQMQVEGFIQPHRPVLGPRLQRSTDS